MQYLKENIKTAVITLFLLVLYQSVSTAELIEPTRFLDGQRRQHGQLSVFSEPPEIKVLFDGAQTWTTPVMNFRVEPGTHRLKVENSEIEFYLAPGQSLRLSYFKGEFIRIPEDSEPDKRTVDRSHMQRQADDVQKKRETKKQDYHPIYWPFNPKGQIY